MLNKEKDYLAKVKIIKFILELSKLFKNNGIRKLFNYFCNINSAINNNSNDNNKLVAKRNDIGVKTDAILNLFSIDNSMSFLKVRTVASRVFGVGISITY